MHRTQAFVVLFFLVQCAAAQDGLVSVNPALVHNSAEVLAQKLNFEKYFTEHGLSSNSIYTIFQDRNGFLWVGTDNGLNRYDGYSFTVYKHKTADSLSLSENNVNLITQDSTGRLWCVNRRGIDGFNYRMEKIIHFPGVKRCYTDRHGTVWMISKGQVSYFDRTVDRRVILQIKPSEERPPAADFSAGAIFVDRNERIWVGTDYGVIRIDRPAHVAQYYKIPRNLQHAGQYPHRVTNIVENDSGSLWLASGQDGLVLFDPIRERYESVDLLPQTNHVSRSAGGVKLTDVNSLPASMLAEKDFAFTVFADKDHVLWIGTAADLFKYDPLHKRSTRYVSDAASSTALSSNLVWSLYLDRSGVLWTGTWEGLNKTIPAGVHFYSPQDYSPNAQFLSKTTIRAICQTQEGVLWVSSLSGMLSRIDRRTNTFVQYSYSTNSDNPFAGCEVHAIFEDKLGLVWFATDEGLLRFDRKNASMKKYRREPGSRSINSNSIGSISEDGKGRLWIGTAEGMNLFDRETDSFQRFNYPNAALGPFVESGGAFWISTWNGLAEFHPEGNTWKWYRHSDDPNSLPSDHLTSICEDKDHNVWLASFGGGCIRYNIRQKTFASFTHTDGLSSDYLFGVMCDDSGNIWMTTKNGLCKLNPRTSNIRSYSTNDGLMNSRFFWGAFHKSRTGLMFVGGGSGMNYFDPKEARENSTIPSIVITSFVVNGKEKINDQVELISNNISLAYTENTFDISFAVLDFVNPTNNKFTYKLEGYETEWTHPGTRREERYVNVPPGSYVLRVKGSNSDGIWNEDGIALAIVISPPWWGTWWFKGAIALAITSLLWAVHMYRMKNIKELQNVRYRIAADLHDELGSNLSSIAVASQTMKRQENISEAQGEQLKSIAETAKKTAETMRDIVWFINPQHESTEDLLLKMKDNAASLLKGVNYSFKMPNEGTELRLSPAQKRNFYLIYKEALHNAAKHARATHLEIEIGISRKEVFLRIVDDGVGFDQANPAKGQGLNSLRRRAHEVGGELTITTVPGSGSTIFLRIPS